MTTLTTLPADTFVTAALAELLDDVTNLLASAQAQKPCDKDEIGFWRRQLSALNKAESYWLQGVRPQIAGDTYLLASASRPGALVHRLSKQGGIVVCSCEACQRGLLCWHHMLINVVERAAELETLATARGEVSGGPEQSPAAQANLIPHREEAAAWLALQTRLAVTAQYVATLRAAQLASDPPGDNPLGDEQGDEVPARRLGLRLVQARRKSAYFASAFYLAA
jgi:hypothetical protein